MGLFELPLEVQIPIFGLCHHHSLLQLRACSRTSHDNTALNELLWQTFHIDVHQLIEAPMNCPLSLLSRYSCEISICDTSEWQDTNDTADVTLRDPSDQHTSVSRR